jgi:hypothetical protein
MKEKSEIRNPKSEGNPKLEIRTVMEMGGYFVSDFGFRIFGFGLPSDFGFRISDFKT